MKKNNINLKYMEITLILAVIGALLSLLNELLAYTPPGYPKSLFQLIVWIIVKIKRLLKKNNINENENITFVNVAF